MPNDIIGNLRDLAQQMKQVKGDKKAVGELSVLLDAMKVSLEKVLSDADSGSKNTNDDSAEHHSSKEKEKERILPVIAQKNQQNQRRLQKSTSSRNLAEKPEKSEKQQQQPQRRAKSLPRENEEKHEKPEKPAVKKTQNTSNIPLAPKPKQQPSTNNTNNNNTMNKKQGMKKEEFVDGEEVDYYEESFELIDTALTLISNLQTSISKTRTDNSYLDSSSSSNSIDRNLALLEDSQENALGKLGMNETAQYDEDFIEQSLDDTLLVAETIMLGPASAAVAAMHQRRASRLQNTSDNLNLEATAGADPYDGPAALNHHHFIDDDENNTNNNNNDEDGENNTAEGGYLADPLHEDMAGLSYLYEDDYYNAENEHSHSFGSEGNINPNNLNNNSRVSSARSTVSPLLRIRGRSGTPITASQTGPDAAMRPRPPSIINNVIRTPVISRPSPEPASVPEHDSFECARDDWNDMLKTMQQPENEKPAAEKQSPPTARLVPHPPSRPKTASSVSSTSSSSASSFSSRQRVLRSQNGAASPQVTGIPTDNDGKPHAQDGSVGSPDTINHTGSGRTSPDPLDPHKQYHFKPGAIASRRSIDGTEDLEQIKPESNPENFGRFRLKFSKV
eukprot:comp22350_c0_seq4/m.53898 comp22350_c0_seq4/g.53898  ORF comp22350_c0_seq4/g.53898 comp22350_c0_seq4/m.53898 type:complete len:618 (-) comp22350_c0_seq4:15-1868(-)